MKRLISLLVTILLVTTLGCIGRSRAVSATSPQGGDFPQSNLLKLPSGFQIRLFASSLDRPRMMALSPDGRLFVSEMGAGRVTILPDADGNRQADSHVVYAEGLTDPHGIAFRGGYLYVAEEGRVVRYPYKAGDNKAPRAQVVIPSLPTDGRHFTKTIVFGSDGKLYVSMGKSVV